MFHIGMPFSNNKQAFFKIVADKCFGLEERRLKSPRFSRAFLFYSRFYPCAGDIFLKAPEEYDIITNEGK